MPVKSQRYFHEFVRLIRQARYNVLKAATREIIDLYWKIGENVFEKAKNLKWELSAVQQLSAYIQEKIPDLKGFSSRNIWRMKQFYETYKDFPRLHPLLQEISWSCHLHILSKTKSMEEKEFYLRLSAKKNFLKESWKGR